MIKTKILQKRLIKWSLGLLLVLAGLGGATVVLYNYNASLEAEQKKLQAKVNTIKKDISTSETKAQDADKYLQLYEKIRGTDEAARLVALDRDVAARWISDVAKRYALSDFDGSAFSPIIVIANKDYQKKTLQGIVSDVSLVFKALSDEQVFRFLEAILEEFPGYVRITGLAITKQEDVTDDMLVAASKGLEPKLVSAKLDFQWIGVQEVTLKQEQQQQEGKNARAAR